MDKEDKGEIAVVEETTAPSSLEFVDPDNAAAYMKNFQEVCEAMLEDTDYQQIGEKKTKKKSAWRKLATAFKVSDEIVNEQLIYDETDGQIVTARYKVRATLPNGRSTIGVGVCSIYDKIRYRASGKFPADTETPSNFELRSRFSNAEHDVLSTAHTRAKNRAIADLIGAGEVSAEELNEEPVKVTRSARNENSNTNNSNSNGDVPKTRNRRQRRKPKTTPESESEVIETKVKEVKEDESSTSNSFEEYAKENDAIKTAINRITEGGDELTKNSIVEELFGLYDLGTITEDEYFKAKEVLGI